MEDIRILGCGDNEQGGDDRTGQDRTGLEPEDGSNVTSWIPPAVKPQRRRRRERASGMQHSTPCDAGRTTSLRVHSFIPNSVATETGGRGAEAAEKRRIGSAPLSASCCANTESDNGPRDRQRDRHVALGAGGGSAAPPGEEEASAAV